MKAGAETSEDHTNIIGLNVSGVLPLTVRSYSLIIENLFDSIIYDFCEKFSGSVLYSFRRLP
jgi:hypothetical protein